MMTNKIKLDTCIISYTQSREDGIPVLLLHENSLGAITYKNIIESKLGEDYRLIAFDLPGHGNSTYSDMPVEDYSLPGLANILKKVAMHLFAENAVFVGHGLGGHIILEALQELTWARGICIFGTPPLSSVSQLNSAYLKDGNFQLLFKGQQTDKDKADFALALAKQEFSYNIKELINKADYRFRKYYGNWIKSGDFFNQKEFLRYLQTPVAILHGEHDQLINYEYISNLKIESLWENEVKLIMDASHSPQLENPKAFIRILTSFLESIL